MSQAERGAVSCHNGAAGLGGAVDDVGAGEVHGRVGFGEGVMFWADGGGGGLVGSAHSSGEAGGFSDGAFRLHGEGGGGGGTGCGGAGCSGQCGLVGASGLKLGGDGVRLGSGSDVEQIGGGAELPD